MSGAVGALPDSVVISVSPGQSRSLVETYPLLAVSNVVLAVRSLAGTKTPLYWGS